MSRFGARTIIARVAITALVVSAALPAFAANPATSGPQLSRDDFERCQSKDTEGLRTAIETITNRAIRDGLAKVDYATIVADQWRRVGLDDILDKRIAAVVADVANEQSLWSKGQSIFDRTKATELATDVATRVYRADDVKAGIDALATAAAREIGKSIELATLDASEPTLKCLQAFIGPRYGSTIARAILADAATLFEPDAGKGVASASPTALSASQSLTGVILIIVRRQLAAMAGKIGQRLVGVVLSRIAGAFAGGIGAVLILKDVWDWRNGVLPIIADEMKSKAGKDQVRAEIAKALSEQINDHTRDIASQTSDRVVEIWREFQRAHAKVVDLADRNGDFRAFIDVAAAEHLPRIDEIVALILAAEGEAGVLKRLETGNLQRAVTALTPIGLEIARDTRSIDVAMAWTALAGAKLAEVAQLGLHKRTSTADITRPELQRILALGDGVAITRLVAIKPDIRAALLQLPDGPLKSLARALDEQQLLSLSGYLTGLQPPVAAQVLQAVAAEPGRMQVLGLARVRGAILASRDQAAAVDMMLKTGALLEPESVARDVRLVVDGRVSALLLWDKHPSAVGLAGLGAVLSLLLLNRLLFGRRRRPVVVAAG